MTTTTAPRGRAKHPTDHDPAAVRFALRRAGLTQADLARAVGRSPGHISEVLAGTRNAPTPLLVAIADALDCPVDLLENKDSAA